MDWTIESGEAPGNDSTIRTSCEIASGRLQPWLNLRRGALAPSDRLRPFRGPLMALLSTLCVALMCSAFALLWRSHHYERIRADHDGRQVELFRELFPGQSIPASVNSRLESEERKARGLSGQYADLPLHRPPLLLLSDTLSALPTSVRYRLLELRLTPEKLYIEGQTRSHSDAEIIVSSIRQGTDFQLDPPRTEQTKDAAIIFNVTGLIPASSPMRGGR